MQNTFICKGCNTAKPINPKLKGNQKYCGDRKCQRKRKAAWQKHKMTTDVNYKQSQQELVQQWRVNKPAHKYQSQYRKNHPSYVTINRDKQRIRNQQRRVKLFEEVIVKMDALTFKEPMICAMTPVEMDATGKIVKMDTLLVQLQLYQRNCEACFSRSP
jgi:hypothetical protein